MLRGAVDQSDVCSRPRGHRQLDTACASERRREQLRMECSLAREWSALDVLDDASVSRAIRLSVDAKGGVVVEEDVRTVFAGDARGLAGGAAQVGARRDDGLVAAFVHDAPSPRSSLCHAAHDHRLGSGHDDGARASHNSFHAAEFTPLTPPMGSNRHASPFSKSALTPAPLPAGIVKTSRPRASKTRKTANEVSSLDVHFVNPSQPSLAWRTSDTGSLAGVCRCR